MNSSRIGKKVACLICGRRFIRSRKFLKYCCEECAKAGQLRARQRFDRRRREIRQASACERVRIRVMEHAAVATVFDAILALGHDEDFEPTDCDGFDPTGAMPGTRDKVAVLTERLQRGLPLWHPHDRTDGDGLDPTVFRIGRVRRDR